MSSVSSINSANPPKAFALVDCNSFYCSCERLFRPDLHQRPVGVLSNNDGCFISLTPELKALGIKMGDPHFKVQQLCQRHKVAVFSSNFSLYTNMSDRVMNTLVHFSPQLEVYSIDEAFLDFSGLPLSAATTEHGWGQDYGQYIKKSVERNTGIPVSIGIAPTKTLAKAANRLAKRHPLFQKQGVVSLVDLPPAQVELLLSQIAVEDLWGIGPRSALKLKMLNIKNAREFRDYSNQKLIQKLLTKVGRMIQDELRGIPVLELNVEVVKKKEILSSRTFGQPVFDLCALRESVANYASLACEKLRQQDSTCAVIEVWVQTNPFKEIPQYHAGSSFKFLSHTADTRKVIKYAWQVLDQLYRQGYEYKKAAVKLSEIRPQHQAQLSLFEPSDSPQAQKLMQVMDQINRKEGPHTVRVAACGVDNFAWKMRQTLKSPRYVSGWEELPIVR